MILYLYKFKVDYSQNVPVELSTEKSRITSAPGFIDELPLKLIDDYYLGGTFGLYTGYLSITIEEYNNNEVPLSIDSISKLLIENDPFIEFYQFEDKNYIFKDENNLEYGIDTSFLNTLIKEGNLEKYFTRLK